MSVDQLVDERIALALDALRRDPPPPVLALGLEDAGRAVGVSGRTIQRWVDRGLLPTVPHTQRVLIPVVALEEFVSAGAPASVGNLTPAGAGGPAGTTDTAHPSPGPVSPLLSLARKTGDRPGPSSTADGGSHPPSAA